MSSAGHVIVTKSTNHKPLGDFRFEVNNNVGVNRKLKNDAAVSKQDAASRRGSPQEGSVSQRKQKYPQSSVGDEEDVEILSHMSDSEEEDQNSLFTYKPPTNGEMKKCDWCTTMSAHNELNLVTQERHIKSFCSQNCQQHYKNSVLSSKVCEWCRQKFPNEPSLIVVEPSMESVPLQFCSQGCINKYKMELFCEEVKEQLRRIKDDNVTMPDVASVKTSRSDKKILITPELWNKGESSLVFVEDYNRTGEGNSHHNSSMYGRSGHHEHSGRKRKGTKMDSVISKLSKRQYARSDYDGEQEFTETPQKQTDGQNIPINLSVYRDASPNSREDNSHNYKQPLDKGTGLQQPRVEDNKPMIIPVPMFIPVPIPIPIPMCLTALSQAILAAPTSQPKQENTTPSNTTRAPSQPSPTGEKRYVLKKQPTSDAPE